jgi:hypothetical protein
MPRALHRQHFPAGGLEFLQVRLGLALNVAADECFGAAGAEDDPFPVRELDFSVSRDFTHAVSGVASPSALFTLIDLRSTCFYKCFI